MTLLELNNEIDQLNSEAHNISPDAAVYLALAWWHTEADYRDETGKCSTGHELTEDQRRYRSVPHITCQCCRYFQSLTNKAQLHRIAS